MEIMMYRLWTFTAITVKTETVCKTVSRPITVVADAIVIIVTADAVDASNATTVTIMQLKQMIMIRTRKQRRNLWWHIVMNIDYIIMRTTSIMLHAIIKYFMLIIIALIIIWRNQQLDIDCMIYNYNICTNRIMHEKIIGLVLGSITQ